MICSCKVVVALPLLTCMLFPSAVPACPDYSQSRSRLNPMSISYHRARARPLVLALSEDQTEQNPPSLDPGITEPAPVQLPPPRPKPIAMVGAGIGAGIVGGLVGAGTGMVIASMDRSPEESWPAIPREAGAALIGFIVAYPLGSAIGVFQLGETDYETASFQATFLLSYLGGGLGLVALGVGMIPGAPIGATIGFNSTRRLKPPPAEDEGLINMREGRVCLGLPVLRSRSAELQTGERVLTTTLAKISF